MTQQQKKLLRQELRELRRKLRIEKADFTVHFLKVVPLPPARTVAGYWPHDNEPDIRPLLQTLSANGHHIVLPVVAAQGQPLVFRAWQAGDSTQPGPYGIPEPLAASPSALPDVLLIPALSVDEEGYRLGYGAGYYDRTLATLRTTAAPVSVAVCYEELRRPRLPYEAHDQPVDYILTERGCWKVR